LLAAGSYGVQSISAVQAHWPRLFPPPVGVQRQVRFCIVVPEHVVWQISSFAVLQLSPVLVPAAQVGKPPSVPPSVPV
jgi:hypothetical protein